MNSPKHVFENLKSTQGHSIFTTLSMIVVTLTVVQVSLHQTLSTYNNIKNSRIVGARDALAGNIDTYVSLGSTFRSSMHPSLPENVNQELKNCILGTGGTPCLAETEIPLTLYYPISSADSTPTTALQILSGPGATGNAEAQPVFYDDRGRLCTQGSDANCQFFQVSTTFIAHCAGGTATCTTAESLSVRYTINKMSNGLIRLPLASVDKTSSPVSRVDILPASASSAANNIAVSLISSVEISDGLSLEDVKNAVLAGGITDPDELNAVTNTFFNAGYKDTSLITAMTKTMYEPWGVLTMIDMIPLIASMGITDPAKANFLASDLAPLN